MCQSIVKDSGTPKIVETLIEKNTLRVLKRVGHLYLMNSSLFLTL